MEVLLRFRLHRIALTADVSRMYRAVLLEQRDKDLHRFVWRRESSEPLRDYRMTRITFGVAASVSSITQSILLLTILQLREPWTSRFLLMMA